MSVITSLLLALQFAAVGQYPGGVGEPLIWLLPNELGGEEGILNQGRMKPDIPMDDEAEAYLNYHPLWKSSPLTIDTDTGLEGESTYFIVYESAEGSSEQSLWSVERDDTTRLIMTTRRFADLNRGLYADYTEGNSAGKLQSYIQQRDSDEGEVTRLTMFDRPVSADLPVMPTKRLVSELIIYDRALSEKERMQVESYLAFKYGLTLKQPIQTMYLDSNGDILWREDEKGDYTYRIAAIGRDNHGAFRNLQSSSVHTDNPVSIAVNEHALNNKQNTAPISNASWLIWSDDNGALIVERPTDITIGRTWNMDVLSARDLTTQVEFDTRRVLTEDIVEQWWMKVSRGEQLPEMYKASDVVNGIASFDSIKWDADGSGADQFTFLPGKDLMPAISVAKPDCGTNAAGTVDIVAYGGKKPYRVKITSEANYQTSFELNAPMSLRLEPGIYNVHIVDADGLMWNGPLTVSSQGMPIPCLKPVMTLPGNGGLILSNEALCLPSEADISVMGGLNHSSRHGDITISEPGHYNLEVVINGCKAYHKFYVQPIHTSIFRHIEVFPNPVKCGDDITYRILLQESADLTLTVHDAAGRQIHQRSLGFSEGFQGKFRSPVIPGTYTLHLSSGAESTSIQFITID